MAKFYDQYKPHAAIQSGMRMIKRLQRVFYKHTENVTLDIHDQAFLSGCFYDLVLAFSPVIPHFCEEMWSNLDRNGLVVEMGWPA
jgi:leucyl-tRNA synthetase